MGWGIRNSVIGYSAGRGQLLPLPWNNITTLSVVFSQDVTINTAAAGLALVGSPDLPSPAVLSSAMYSYDSITDTAQWTFAAPALDKYQLDLPSAAVTIRSESRSTANGRRARATFPSGDGTGGGGLAFRFNILPGDVDQNGVVTGMDGNAVRIAVARYDTTELLSLLDVNADGAITGQDGSAIRLQLLQASPSTIRHRRDRVFAIPARMAGKAEVGGQKSEVGNQVAGGGGSSSGAATAPCQRLDPVHLRLRRAAAPAIHDLVIEGLTADEIPQSNPLLSPAC